MLEQSYWSFLAETIEPIYEEKKPQTEDDIKKMCEKVNRNERTRTPRGHMAEHIFKHKNYINETLEKEELSVEDKSRLVDLIAEGGFKNDRPFIATSFASKYCSYFNWGFPKYDGLLLKFLNRSEIADITGVRNIREHDYNTFISALMALHHYLSEQKLIKPEMTLEELDFIIWNNEARKD